EPDEADRRQEYLDLTAQGRAAYRDLHGVAQGYDAVLADTLTAEEERILRGALRKLARMG
ncbi:MAG: MarR family transcriptional regulator, partial [Rhodobacterales bacterium]|nr:MarR family transcriptional regulator [Rhodobacterales bacterium]MDX5412306.1 MarR family transcriptional regulator [Rhodobacterales bacterium]